MAQTGRNAQGVRLIRLAEDEKLVGVEAIEAVEDELEILENTESAADDVTDAQEAEKDDDNTVEE